MRTGPSTPVGDPSIRQLLAAALAVRHRAYAPYSRFPVGAAVLADDGKIYAGCNVENASYPVGLCAERSAIGQAVARGARRILAAALVCEGEPIPCGMCLQAFAEFADPEMPILLATPEGRERRVRLGDLLPQGFRLERS
jgi:cytidine deaminase